MRGMRGGGRGQGVARAAREAKQAGRAWLCSAPGAAADGCLSLPSLPCGRKLSLPSLHKLFLPCIVWAVLFEPLSLYLDRARVSK